MSERDTTDQPTPGDDLAQSRAAQVHDLGYKRYRGARKAQSTRYRVIARKVVATSWRGWWRMKLWILGAVMTAFVVSVIMYVSEGVSRFVRHGQQLPLSDALMPMSFQFFEIGAFALTLTVIAAIVASDMRTGAFEFYFARPVRSWDYMLGKVLGALLVVGMVLFTGPVVLAFVRIGLSASGDLGAVLPVLPKAAFVGFLASLVYAIVPLAFSALSSHKRKTLPAWAAFYFLTTVLVPVVSEGTGIRSLQALDIPGSIHTLAYAVFDVVPLVGARRPPAWTAVLGLSGYIFVSLGLLYWRVSAAEKRGMGGG